MATIKVLDSITKQSIAAGEVVERPSSVVKELVENSLDAKSTRIAVYIRNGGKTLVKVVDNGIGMSEEDVLLAIKDHATSKITSIEDLDYISTLGFRGEALPTITAVSRMRLESRRAEDEMGTEVLIEGGKLISVNKLHCNVGTTIEVKDLFFNTPARFKFMNTDQGEASNITDIMQELALARPDVAFFLENKGVEVLHTPGDNQLISAIYAILGQKAAKGMSKVIEEISPSGVKVSGYIGLPEISRKSRKWEYFFVNGRCINSPALTRAIEDAYKSTLMTRKYPVCVIKIDLPSNLVDVNVHPRKLEVRFWNDSEVFRTVYSTVQNSLFTALRPAVLVLEDKQEPYQDVSLNEKESTTGEFNKLGDNSTELQKSKNNDSNNKSEDFEIILAPKAKISEDKLIDFSDIDYGPGMRRSKLDDGSILVEARADRENNSSSENVKTVTRGVQNKQDNKAKIHFDFTGLGRISDDSSDKVSENTYSSIDNVETIAENKAEYENEFLEEDLNADNYSKEDNLFRSGEEDNKSNARTQVEFFDTYGLSEQEIRRERFRRARYSGELFKTYLLFEIDDSVIVIDQHAAHEKVLFEEALTEYEKNKVLQSQVLLKPVQMEVSPQDELLLQENPDFLARYGFDVDAFGPGEVIIRAIPISSDVLNPEAALSYILDDALSNGVENLDANSDLIYHVLATIACKAAVKAHDVLEIAEVEELRRLLLGLKNPYNCPHGRPIILEVSRQDLEKLFKRIVS